MNSQKLKIKKRRRKALHVRRCLAKNPNRPRLSVFRSTTHIYCQVIDDLSGRTLCAASSVDKDMRSACTGLKKTEVAAKVGEAIAQHAKDKGIQKVKFDRGWHCYHGRVKALADAAREAGLEF